MNRHIKCLFLLVFTLIFHQGFSQSIRQIIQKNTIVINDSIEGLWVEGFIIIPDRFLCLNGDSLMIKSTHESPESIHTEKSKLISLPNCSLRYFLLPYNMEIESEYFGEAKFQESKDYASQYYLISWNSIGKIEYSNAQYKLRQNKDNSTWLLLNEGKLVEKSGILVEIRKDGLKVFPFLIAYYNSEQKQICEFNKDLADEDLMAKEVNATLKNTNSNDKKTQNDSKEGKTLDHVLETDKGPIKRFIKDGLFGYRSGDEIIVDAKYIYAEPFNKGRAVVCESIDSCYTINKKGKCIKNCP